MMTTAKCVLRYEAIERIDREKALRQIEEGGILAANALYSVALYDEDDAFAQRLCLKCLDSEEESVRYAAAGALGEMAMFIGRNLDFALVEPRLVELREKHPQLASVIQDSLDDFAFVKNCQVQTNGERS